MIPDVGAEGIRESSEDTESQPQSVRCKPGTAMPDAQIPLWTATEMDVPVVYSLTCTPHLRHQDCAS
jgi:hypothetical protein